MSGERDLRICLKTLRIGLFPERVFGARRFRYGNAIRATKGKSSGQLKTSKRAREHQETNIS